MSQHSFPAPLSGDEIAAAFRDANSKSNMIILVGLPASGKSLLATSFEDVGYQRLNKDRLRLELYGDENDHRDMAEVNGLFYERLHSLLASGTNVVVDNTNIFPGARVNLTRLAEQYGYASQTVFVDTPLKVCLRRNAARSRVTPEETVRFLHHELYHNGGYPKSSEGALMIVRPDKPGYFEVRSLAI